jgi:hypothetical protein
MHTNACICYTHTAFADAVMRLLLFQADCRTRQMLIGRKCNMRAQVQHVVLLRGCASAGQYSYTRVSSRVKRARANCEPSQYYRYWCLAGASITYRPVKALLALPVLQESLDRRKFDNNWSSTDVFFQDRMCELSKSTLLWYWRCCAAWPTPPRSHQ